MSTNKSYNDYFKSFADFKAPNFDINGLFAIQRRNFETFSAVNQIMSECAQNVAKRQSENARAAFEGYIKASKDILTNKAPEINTQKQVDYAKSVVEDAVSSAREISETVSRSATEAFETLSKRASDAAKEFSDVASNQQAQATKASKAA